MLANEVLIYLRKSRSDNPEESVEITLSRHEDQLQDYALNSLGFNIPEGQIYREVVSGETIIDRPEMQRLLKKIENVNIKAVLVIEPQRLTRGDLQDCGIIVNSFRYSNTLVLTPQKRYNLEDKFDRKFFEMELMRGNDYLEYTKEILMRGRIASVKKGNFIGSVAPYGYKKVTLPDKSHTLEIVQDEADTLKLMYDLFVNKNYGFAKIAKELNNLGIKPKKQDKWSKSSIKDMLENPVYIGKIRWNWRMSEKVMENGKVKKTRPKSSEDNWILVDGKHNPIIDIETYNATLAKRGKNVPLKKDKNIRNPFAGILFCECGKAMVYQLPMRKGINRAAARLYCTEQTYCHNKSVLYSEFETYIIDCLKETIKNFEIQLKNEDKNAIKYHENIISKLQKELENIEKKDDEQHDLLEEGIYSREVFIKRNSKLQEEKKKIKASIEKAKTTLPTIINYEEKIVLFTEALNALEDKTVPPEIKNAFLKKCINKIIYTRKAENNNNEYRKSIPFSLEIRLNL